MYKKMFFTLSLLLFTATMAVALENGADGGIGANGADGTEAKTLSGMSVLGNNEAPMSLFIVPWKSSELGVGADLKRTLDERDQPVDRDVFMREIDFFRVSVGDNPAATASLTEELKSR